jgi:Spy/CpxP family protein refolding chaperone
MGQQRQLMSKATIDKSAVLSLQSKINSLKADLSNARIDMALTASAVFTPEQREMFSKFGHGRGHGGPGMHKMGRPQTRWANGRSWWRLGAQRWRT